MTNKMVESAWPNIVFFSSPSRSGNTKNSKKTWTSSIENHKKRKSDVFNRICHDNNLLPKYTIYIYIYREREVFLLSVESIDIVSSSKSHFVHYSELFTSDPILYIRRMNMHFHQINHFDLLKSYIQLPIQGIYEIQNHLPFGHRV